MAVMLFRQIVEHDARGGAAVADLTFVPHSTNVYAGFLEFLLGKLARSPFGNLDNATLEQFCGNLEKWQVACEAQIAIPAMRGR